MIITATDIRKGDVITTAGRTLQVSHVSNVVAGNRLWVEGRVAGDRATHIIWLSLDDTVVTDGALI